MPSSPTAPSRSRRTGKRAGNHLLQERSASFHGGTKPAAVSPADLRRHKTQPALLSGPGARRSNISMVSTPDLTWRKVPSKILVNVNVQRSLGALQVMASTEWTVGHLVGVAVQQYVKEGRRPLLTSVDPSSFGLHYSQFSLEGLDPKEKLAGLGSRNFFLCTVTSDSGRRTLVNEEEASTSSPPLPSSSSSSCSSESEKASKLVIPWLRFMDFLF